MTLFHGARGLYAILDPEHLSGRAPLDVAAAILEGGAAVLQLRAKRLGDAELVALARSLRELTRAHALPFVVNDRADVAALVGADGLHLGQDDLPIEDARRVVGAMPIGLSTHSLAQARDAVSRGADLIGFGPVFATATKENPDPVVGLEQLGAVCRAVAIPVVAIGGITESRVREVRAAGATFVAAISAITGSVDPREAARTFHALAR